MSNSEKALQEELQDLKNRLSSAEAKHAEALLELRQCREGLASWRRVIHEADVPIAIHEGPQHIFRFKNKRYDEITGNRDCIGQTKRESFPDLEGQGVFESFDEVYRTGRHIRLPELQFLAGRPGERAATYFSQVLQPWFGPDSQIAGVMSISHDVTEQAREREKAQQSLRLFQATGENIPYGVWWYEPSGKVVYLSPSLLDFVGKGMEDIQGEEWMSLLSADEAKPARRAWKECVDEKEDWEFEYQLRGANGEYSTVLSVGRPILNKRGDLLAYAGLNLDITDRKEAEEELLRARDAANAANRAKSAFLANMSHDIRTPLTAIVGYSEVLSTRVEGQNAEIVSQIYNACTHLQSILDSVLKYARLESGATRLETKPEALAPQVRKTVAMLQTHAGENGIHVCLEIEDEGIQASIDIGAFNRVLANILDNAIKYSSRGQRVDVCLSRAGKASCLAVRDFGIGMSESFRSRLFEPFAQEREKQPENNTGAGLGMAITRQLVELMGGTIEVDSAEGKGAEFRVCFPLEGEVGQDGITTAGEPATPESNYGDSGSLRVLVCEDSFNTQQVLKYMLTEYEVTFASTELELLDSFDRHDVVLLDINIGGRNIGNEMLGRLRLMDGGKDSRIVAFTAHSLPGQGEEFLAAGFDDYLPKPFTKKELLNVINSAIDAR